MLPLIHSEEGEAMDRGRPLKPLEVSGSTREELESLSRSLSLAAGLVSRAKIVLLCADGFDNKAVAEEVGTSRQTVGKWRERFRTQGLMGLYDERRPGKPRSIEDDEVMVLLRKTLDTEPADGSTHWSCRSMADTTGVKSRVVCKSERKLLDASVRLPWRPPWARGVRGPGNGARSRAQ